ncbi:MAG: TonB-dependent receptor [Prevotella sp.]|nr:TonB-dependent receptor [Prevotella sp.]
MAIKTLLLSALSVLPALLFADTSSLTGTVLTGTGTPLPYAYVSVEGKAYTTQADKNGCYTLRLPDGKYTITAEMLGYLSDTKEVEISGAATADFVLKEDLINLGIVTVTGTRTPRVLSSAPVVTQVITEDDIHKLDATNLKDVLTAEMPGLEFTYSMNQQISLSMQGLGGMAILVLVDGERLAGETLDNPDFFRLNTDNIERIEIIKGAASALYGSNSVGAVINIITKTAEEGWHANVNTHFGAHGEQRHGGALGIKSGRWSSLTDVQTNSIDTYDIHDTEGDGATTVYGNRQWNFKEKLLFQADKDNLLTARAGYYFHERYYADYKNDRARDFSGSLRWQSTISAKSKLDISYTFDRYDKSNYYTQLEMDFLSYKNVQNSLRALYTVNPRAGITWIAGGDAMSDYLMSYQFEDNGSHRQLSADIFTQAEWIISKHWNIVAGLRADWLSKSGWDFSPKLAAMYTLGDLNIRAAFSHGFRAPTLKEKFMNFDMSGIFMIYGNQDLKPEQSHNLSLSAEYARSRYSITATAYYNILHNEISTLWDTSLYSNLSPGAMAYHNIEGRNLLGADITLMARYPCGIGAKVSYAYFHEFPRKGGYNLSDSRPHSLTVKVDYRRTLRNYEYDVIFSGRVLSSVNYYTYSDDYTSQDVRTHSPAYSIWKIALSQRICRAYTLLLAVDNLFNYRSKKFEYNSPVTTGTTFSATLSVDIEQIFKKQ